MKFLFAHRVVVTALLAVIVASCDIPEPPDSPSTTTSDEVTDYFTEPPSPTISDQITQDPSTAAPTTTDPSPPPSFDPPMGSVPSELVGEWDGDGTSVRFDKIAFFSDGGVRLIYNSGLVLDGTAVVEGSSMTLYVSIGPIPYEQWSIEEFDAGYGYTFENLWLNGVSYVRQTSGG